MSDRRLGAAILNNIAWCDAVVRAHGGEIHTEPAYWINTAPSPRFYPNLITLSRGDLPEQLLAIARLRERLPPGWGVKDSFATLDLAALGFRKLFDATWLARAPKSGGAYPGLAGLEWRMVETADDLARWERGLEDGAESDTLFHSMLLDDPSIGFLGLWDGGRAIAGAAFNRHEGACGITNVFSARDLGPNFLKGIVRFASVFAQERPLVCYLPEGELAGWREIGFEALGALRVWIAG